jgi:adenylate cyclase
MFPTKPAIALGTWGLAGILLVAGAVIAIRAGTALPLLALMLTWLAYAAASFSYHRYCDFQGRRAVERLFGRYVSPNIAKRLLEDPSLVHPGGRKKTLTILFSDIRGFTSLSERLQPEQVTEILNLYFTEMMSILFAFDGTYDKFIGDALLAFFGDPVDQPDHSERALDCALAMQKKASELRTRFSNKGLLPLHIGIAVHAGPVVVGNHGSRDNWSYTVIGDTVNLASRLQGLAQHDDIIVSRSTAERVPGFASIYRYEELEPVRVKGKAQPVSILRVLGSAREEMRS